MNVLLPRVLIVAGCISLLLKLEAAGNPIGGQVRAGSATFEGGPNALTIRQSSERGIIHWQDFSIGSGESVKFLQPSAASAILNRVTGGKRSELMGMLQANGNVYLINPSGILIGSSAVIDTNSFIASTLDVNDEQFMAGGDLKFMGDSTASVTNLGKITARGGDIFLIANTVENAGALEAPGGTVGLAAGQEVLLKSAGDERLFIAPTSKSSSVHNSGTITGATAELKASGNLYALAINNTGTIRATGLVNKNGRVILSASGGEVRNSGTLSARNANGSGGYVKMDSGRGGKTVNAGTIDASGKAKGAKGGRVEVLGEHVELTASSLVDVSGDTGGGVALIGGDKQGKNPAIQNAKTTKVAKGAVINADAISSGDGGTAIVWADDSTDFAGTITARGGAGGGNGGFAEVSGKDALSFTGMVDLSAMDGNFGTLLLDPKNTRVATGGAATPGDVGSFGTNAGTDAVIAPDTLRDLLANILIQTNNDFTLQSALDLTSTTGGTATSGKSFTVQAGRTIQIEAALTTAGGAVNMTANSTTSSGVVAAHRDGGTAAIVFQAGGGVTTNGGDVNLTIDTGAGLTDNSSGDISFTTSTIDAGTGNVRLLNKGPGNGGQQGAVMGFVAGKVVANELYAEAEGNIWFLNDQNDVNSLFVTNGSSVLFTDADDLIAGKSVNMGGGNFSYTGSLQVGKGDVKITTKTGNLTLNAPAFQPTTNSTPMGVFSLEAGGKLLVNEGVNKLLTQIGVDVTYKAGTDVEIKAVEIGARNLTAEAANNISLNFVPAVGKYGIYAQDINPHGIVTFTAGNNILGSSASTISARHLQMTATAGKIDLDGIANVNLLAATAAGNVAVDGTFANSIGALGNISSGGNITVNDHSLGLQIEGLVKSTAVNGVATIKATGGGTVQFLPFTNGRIEVGAGGQIVFESKGQILDGTTPSFVGGSLALTARAIGGGTTNPINTQVGRLEGAALASSGFGGFAFLTNNEAAAGALAIGGVSTSMTGFTGNGVTSGGVSVNLTNNGSIVLDQSASGDCIGAASLQNPPGDVSVTANGATSDISIGSGSFGVGIISEGKLTLTSGRNILVGESGGFGVRGLTGVELSAGNSIFVKNDAPVIVLGSGLLRATAVNSIQVTPSANNAAMAFRSGTDITLIAQSGQITLGANNGQNPVVRAGEIGGAGAVVLRSNKMLIDGRIEAGATGTVTLEQFDPLVSVAVGVKSANELSFTDAELDRISAQYLRIGSLMANPTSTFVVNADITRPASATYANLQLQNVGSLAVQNTLDMGLGNLSLLTLSGNMQGAGDIAAHDLSLFSSTGSVNLSGDLSVVNLEAFASGGSISLMGDNSIQYLTGARFDTEFLLTDNVGGLVVEGIVDGGAQSRADIVVPNGPITLNQGAKFYFGGGANQILRLAGNGFSNQSGDANVLVPENGGRWLIYSPSPEATTLNGIAPDYRMGNTTYPTVPFTPGNGLLLASAHTDVTPPPAPPANFVPAVPRLFTASQETVLEQLSRRFRELPDGNLSDLMKNDVQSVKNFVLALQDLREFLRTEGQAALNKGIAEGLSTETSDADRSAGDKVDARRLGFLFLEWGRILPDLVTNSNRFLAGEGTLDAAVTSAQAFLENMGDIAAAYDARMKWKAEEAARLAKAAAVIEANLRREAQLSILDKLLQPEGLTQAQQNLLMLSPMTALQPGSNFSPLAMTPAQLSQLSRGQVLRMLALKGAVLSPLDMIAAKTASFTPDQFARMVAAGGGNLTGAQFSAMVAAGGGNLTINEMVAAGGMNMVAAGGMNFKVVDRVGNILSHNGGTLKFSEFAKLIGNDGGTLIGNDGSTLIGNDGSTLIGNDGSTLIGNDGSTLIGNDGSTLIGNDGSTLIGNDGSTFAANLASLIGNDGSTFIRSSSAILSHNGGQVLSHNGGVMIGQGGSQLIQGVQAGSNAISIGGGVRAGAPNMQFNPRE